MVHLLPSPKRIELTEGQIRVGANSIIRTHDVDDRVRRAVENWLKSLPRNRDESTIDVSVAPGRFDRAEEYRLSVTQAGVIELIAANHAAAFHGLQTLQQLARNTETIPCCDISDWPDFTTRGLLHDVTRGKVPTLGTLKQLVDRLACLKINQLQLNIEHAFVFSFDSEICTPDDGLTPDEIRELDAYCRDRFIDLVPALATFGHMGRILSMPKYRQLAEVEATKPWNELAWPQRMRGFTLDCMNPEAHRLVERMWTDILSAFSSPIVNICGDEPWDLGQGKNKNRLPGKAKGAAYLDYIRRTHDFCRSRGKQTQFWSDVVTHYPQLYDRIPKDAQLLHWGYDDRSDYEGTRSFVDTGLPTIVCPGVSGWKRVLNGLNLAERNLTTFAAAGKKHGAIGFLNTDWGDHGHFNLLGCSSHGIALGAALAWTSNHDAGEKFDHAFVGSGLTGVNSHSMSNIRAASRLGDSCESWRHFWQPIGQSADEEALPSDELLSSIINDSRRAHESLRSKQRVAQSTASATAGLPNRDASTSNSMSALDFTDLAIATRFNELAAKKLLFVHALKQNKLASVKQQMTDWCDRVLEAIPEYESCWLARNKQTGLVDIQSALRAAIADVRARAGSPR